MRFSNYTKTHTVHILNNMFQVMGLMITGKNLLTVMNQDLYVKEIKSGNLN